MAPAPMKPTLTALAVLVGLSAAADASEVRGPLEYVYDGDTFLVAGVKIRLNGLHAPEMDEAGGAQARAFMRSAYEGRILTCVLNGDRSHDRWIGVCYGPGGEDVSAALVSAGLGRDCRRYSGGRYARYETRESRRLRLPGYCR